MKNQNKKALVQSTLAYLAIAVVFLLLIILIAVYIYKGGLGVIAEPKVKLPI